MLVRIRHYYQNPGVDSGEVLDEEIEDFDGETKDEAQDYVDDVESEVYVLDNNEYARPTYYWIDDDISMPDWTDGGNYDYDECDFKDDENATCESGCDNCPYYEQGCLALQKDQQIEWVKENGERL